MEIQVKAAKIDPAQQPLVDQSPVAQRRHVELVHAERVKPSLHLLAREEELALELVMRNAIGPPHQKMQDGRAGSEGLFTEDALVDGNSPPAQKAKTLPRQCLGHNLLAVAAPIRTRGEKEQADGKVSRAGEMNSQALEFRVEHGIGNLSRDTGAIAGFAVCVHGAPVRHAPQCAQSERKNVSARATLCIGHKTHTTGVVFKSRIIQRAGGYLRVRAHFF